MDEADVIAKKILENVSHGRRYGDHAILYRMNSQSNNLERVFVKSGIRYKIIARVLLPFVNFANLLHIPGFFPILLELWGHTV